MDILTTRASETLSKAMDGLMIRHDAISSNLANVDTPGYKPVKVEFEGKLKEALEKQDALKHESRGIKLNDLGLSKGILDLKITDEKHLGAKKIQIGDIGINAYKKDDISFRTDENGVDIDIEMTELAKNSMQYEAITTLQSKHYLGMKEIIKSGGG